MNLLSRSMTGFLCGAVAAVSAQSLSVDTVVSRVKATLSQIHTYQADADVAYFYS